MTENKNTILKRAYNIIDKRSEEKERQYGPMNESIETTAKFASMITNKDITPDIVFAVLTGLKMSRISHSFKTQDSLPDNDDSMMDLCAYLGAWQNYEDSKHIIKKNNNNNN